MPHLKKDSSNLVNSKSTLVRTNTGHDLQTSYIEFNKQYKEKLNQSASKAELKRKQEELEVEEVEISRSALEEAKETIVQKLTATSMEMLKDKGVIKEFR